MQSQMLNQFDQTRMMLITDSTRVVVDLGHVLVIDVLGEKVRIGELRVTIGTLRIDLLEKRVVVLLRLMIDVLTEMDDQLNIVLQDHILTDGTLERDTCRSSLRSVDSYLTPIVSIVGERTVSTRLLSIVLGERPFAGLI